MHSSLDVSGGQSVLGHEVLNVIGYSIRVKSIFMRHGDSRLVFQFWLDGGQSNEAVVQKF